ncbi:hypothetical protein ACFLZC_01020 [Patescibacteria group bacterium]
MSDKIRPYRIFLKNVPVTDLEIEEVCKEELGDVKVVSWEVERNISYEDTVIGAVTNNGVRPQNLYIIKLSYREKE